MNVGSYRSALYGPLNTKKSLPRFTIGDRSILDKRIHTNPKFNTVTSRTDSGFNTRRKEELQKEIQKYYKISNNEVFSRISLSDLMQLMIAHTHEYQKCGEPQLPPVLEGEEEGNQKKLDAAAAPSTDNEVDTVTQMQSSKANENNGPATHASGSSPPPPPPYLLVDVRLPTDHAAHRLISSVSHPLARLSRSVNWENRELLLYRNHPNWIIVLYDFGEDVVHEYAATLIHRGYENIFVLSGGLKLAQDKFGFPLVLDKEQLEKRDGDIEWRSLWSLSNDALPADVAEELTQQLSHVILPPLSSRGAGAELWLHNCAARGPGSVASSSTAVSVAGTARTAYKGPGSTVSTSRTSKIGASGPKPWR